MTDALQDPDPAVARRGVMALLARTPTDTLVAALRAFNDVDAQDVRSPAVGLVMVRGRIAGRGAPFNLGEATATRAAVRLGSGETGWACVLGRDLVKARAAAIGDALWQAPDHRDALETKVLRPLREALAEHDRLAAERTAATRVDFLTLVRGED